MDIVLGVGDYTITNQENDVIKTYALGSCVAFVVYSMSPKVLAMAHIALPDSNIDTDMDSHHAHPGYFANTASRLIMNSMTQFYGCKKENLRICLIGGARSSHAEDVFKIGQKNVEAVMGILESHKLAPHQMDVGGDYGRTVEASVINGEISIYKCRLIGASLDV